MKLLFASLICHRDVEIFKFNWFSCRIHLDHGFDMPHLLLNDGSLTDEDKIILNSLPGIILDPDPITVHDIPKPILTAKLQCFDRGFQKYDADRVIIIDADIFFYKPWDSVIKKILMSGAICLKDWGSSLGPNTKQYKALFGVEEDATTPNCNTGIYSIPKELHHKIGPILDKHINDPFQIMEDQGIFFASYYGELEYIYDIKCIINGTEEHGFMWDDILRQKGSHLQGMRVRPKALQSLINHTINSCPRSMHLNQINPTQKYINYGLLSFGGYDFTKPWQEFPSFWEGKFVIDGMHIHGGSWALWNLPPQITHFDSQIVCMHTGLIDQCKPVRVNGHEFNIGDKINIECQGELKIETEYTPGAHLCFISPMLKIKLDPPNLSF